MENKTAEEILKEFENFCGNLAVSGDSPSSDTIKQYFDEYASQKLAEKDKEIEEFAIGFTEWFIFNGFEKQEDGNYWVGGNVYLNKTQLIELYKQSLNK